MLFRCLPRQPGPGLSLESYVYNILYEVMLPQPGRSIRIYLPPEEPQLPPIAVILQRPELNNELPLLDFPVRLLFSYLDIECIIQLFTCVLLENQVLLRSNGKKTRKQRKFLDASISLIYFPIYLVDYQKLMIVSECITSLLLPFTWPHVYAPILPAALHHFLDAPVPFVMGLHAECETNTKIGSEATLCYVDIDKKTIQLPEELPQFPHKYEFMSEITTVLDKFHVERDKTLEQFSLGISSSSLTSSASSLSTSILNPKMFYHQRGSNSGSDYDVMTSSCTLPSGMHQIKRKPPSIMHENNSSNNWITDRLTTFNGVGNGSTTSSGNGYYPLSHQNIIKRTGVQINELAVANLENDDKMPSKLQMQQQQQQQQKQLTKLEQYYEDQRLNNSIREIFLNRFVHIFSAYEHFVIYPNQNKDDWLSNRETLQNFDKASFLSDQPEHHRPFLSRFLESQMFATLIDNKIMSIWDNIDLIDTNLKLFDNRLKILRFVWNYFLIKNKLLLTYENFEIFRIIIL